MVVTGDLREPERYYHGHEWFAYANHPMNNLDNYAEEMGWAEWTADGGGDDLEGMEAECKKAWEVARERCKEKGVTKEAPLKFID